MHNGEERLAELGFFFEIQELNFSEHNKLKYQLHDQIKKTHPVVDGTSLNFGTIGTWRATLAKAPRGTALVTSCFRG